METEPKLVKSFSSKEGARRAQGSSELCRKKGIFRFLSSVLQSLLKVGRFQSLNKNF